MEIKVCPANQSCKYEVDIDNDGIPDGTVSVERSSSETNFSYLIQGGIKKDTPASISRTDVPVILENGIFKCEIKKITGRLWWKKEEVVAKVSINIYGYLRAALEKKVDKN